MNKLTLWITGAVASVGMAIAGICGATMDASTTEAINGAFTSLKDDLLALIVANIPTIFLVVAAIVGLTVLYRLFRRMVGR